MTCYYNHHGVVRTTTDVREPENKIRIIITFRNVDSLSLNVMSHSLHLHTQLLTWMPLFEVPLKSIKMHVNLRIKYTYAS